MSSFEKELLKTALQCHLSTFIQRSFQTTSPGRAYQDNWHIDAIAHHLTLAAEGSIKRLIITTPPRMLKSLCASVAFPAWVLGRRPNARIICVSYSAELAALHARQSREIINSRWYKKAFPGTRLSSIKNTENEVVTTAGGFRYTTSVPGTLTGRGGDIIIVDDPIKADDAMSEAKRSDVNEWFLNTLHSRLDDQRTGGIILVMQRLHVDDLVGHLLRTQTWTHLRVPAIAEVEEQIAIGPDRTYFRRAGEVLHPERDSRELLERRRIEIGNFRFAAQYQQRPIPPDGELIKWDWFRRYDELPVRRHGDYRIQSWDTAMTDGKSSDFSVCTTWYIQGNDYYLMDVLRVRLNYPDLRRRIIDHALHWGATPIIEDKGSGTSLIQDLRQSSPKKPIAFRPEGDKVTRLIAQTPKIEAGHVYLPQQADWLDDFREELLLFPHGRYDDQIDSLAQFLNWIDHRRRYRTIIMGLHEFGIG